MNDKIPTLAEVEREHILRALDHAEGNRTKAAQVLDIGVRTIQRKLKEYGIAPRVYVGATLDNSDDIGPRI